MRMTASWMELGIALIIQLIESLRPSFFEMNLNGLRTLRVLNTLNLDKLEAPSIT